MKNVRVLNFFHTYFRYLTVITVRFSGMTYLPSVENQKMMRAYPLILRNSFFKLIFRPVHILGISKAYPVGYSEYMSIHGYGRFSESLSHNNIRGFSAHTGKTYQIIKIRRHLSSKIFKEFICQTDYVLRFILVQTNRLNYFHNFSRVCRCKILRTGISFK